MSSLSNMSLWPIYNSELKAMEGPLARALRQGVNSHERWDVSARMNPYLPSDPTRCFLVTHNLLPLGSPSLFSFALSHLYIVLFFVKRVC